MNILYYVASILFVVIQNVVCSGVRVKVKEGWLEGEILDLVTGDGCYYSFKGIPFARPPNGTLRFKAPEPPLPWNGIRKAKKHGHVCSQYDILTDKFILEDEDCLFLNVYSPNLKPRKRLPVIVFIHGGAYKSGSGDVYFYGPDFLVRQDMVVVTLNHRLDALGFLCLGTEDVPGNAGLKDQLAALQWVQWNIKQFGGDPRKVTFMGHSSGGGSVALHITSPAAKGLFHRAIILSGSAQFNWALPFDPVRRAFVLGKDLGFKTEDPDDLLQFLQSVPVEKLLNTSPNILSFEEYTHNKIKMYEFIPVEERSFDEDNLLIYDTSGKFEYMNDVDILFGHTNHEVVSLIDYIASDIVPMYYKFPELIVPRDFLDNLGPNEILKISDAYVDYYFGNKTIDINSIKAFMKFASYATFVYDIMKYFLKMPPIKKAVFAYKFSISSSRNVNGLKGEKYGIHKVAAHMDDLMYLFDAKAFNLPLERNSEEFVLMDIITTIYADFAKHGNPYHSVAKGRKWPTFNPRTREFVNLHNNGSQVIATISNLYDDDQFNFWDGIYSSVEQYILNDFGRTCCNN